MSISIGVDVGGTFTDLYCVDRETSAVHLHKTLSSPSNPADAILRGLEELSDKTGIDLSEVSQLAHGTTVATNALIQRRGTDVTLITTEGFRDLLEIGRQVRPNMFSLKEDYPAPLASRDRRWEVGERMLADGSVLRPLSDDMIEEVLSRIEAEKPGALAIAFLHSFVNPEHEARLAAAIRARYPDLLLSVSSEVQPEFREYERTSTTVLNSYLLPVMDRYIRTLEEGFAKDIPNAKVGINQSSGGLMSLPTTRAFPIRTGLSGPAAGVVGAIWSGRQSNRPNMITLDMGGTSADVCLIRDLKAGVSYSGEIAEFPVRTPMVDVHTVGAGGGSIAWFDADGLMKVGPYSAGAIPGPACYNKGGTETTVSDANLILGRLPSTGLLGGQMPLDKEASLKAIAPIAERLGYSPEKTAQGIISIVVANMVAAVRVISIERGHDARDFTLVAMGGAGALHSCEVARELGIKEVLVPAAPGILCAQGLIVADQREEFVQSGRMPFTEDTEAALTAITSDLAKQASEWFATEAVDEAQRELIATIDMRYVGQNFELPITLPLDPKMPKLPDLATLKQAFFDAHEQLYGFHNPGDPIEVINTRLAALGRNTETGGAAPQTGGGAPIPVTTAPVWFDGDEPVETGIYDRATFKAGQSFAGPAIITQLDATTVVFPGDAVHVDAAGNLLIEIVK